MVDSHQTEDKISSSMLSQLDICTGYNNFKQFDGNKFRPFYMRN
jgi:hypothetical protein